MAIALTDDQLSHYHEHGWLLVRNGVPADALQLAHTALTRWVDGTVQGWVEQGLLPDAMLDQPFERRLVKAWSAAGRPRYMRSPRRDIVCRETFEFLAHPALVDIAQDLLDTAEISVNGVFNARPKLPDQKWTDTPWHQDAQYYRDAANIHIVSMWMPLVPVTEKNSCLQVAARMQNGKLFDNFQDETGFIGLTLEDRASLHGISVEMNPGDVLCFPQKTPHRALPNMSDTVRWSMDIRFEASATASEAGKRQGFVARSQSQSETIPSYAQWLEQWAAIPAGGW
jgi:phytanoyl-CoA hydroxylase